MTTTPIEFGPTDVPVYKRIPVTFRYVEGDELKVEKFNVLDKTVDVATANQMLVRTQNSDMEAFAAMVNLVARYMDDKDGTPSRWKPVALAPKPSDTEDSPARFRAPNGKIRPMSEAAGWLTYESGSSRRRWLHLMNQNDEAAVELETMQKLVEFLMEVAGKDRTRA